MTESKLFFMNIYSIHFDWLTVVNHMNVKSRLFLRRGLSQRQDIENYIQSAIFCQMQSEAIIFVETVLIVD